MTPEALKQLHREEDDAQAEYNEAFVEAYEMGLRVLTMDDSDYCRRRCFAIVVRDRVSACEWRMSNDAVFEGLPPAAPAAKVRTIALQRKARFIRESCEQARANRVRDRG